MFDTVVASTTSAVSSSLTSNLPAIGLVFAGLVGLGISIRYIKKWIGRK